jgi:hypothetical protein
MRSLKDGCFMQRALYQNRLPAATVLDGTSGGR